MKIPLADTGGNPKLVNHLIGTLKNCKMEYKFQQQPEKARRNKIGLYALKLKQSAGLSSKTAIISPNFHKSLPFDIRGSKDTLVNFSTN